MNTRRLLSTFAAVLLLCTLALTGCSTKKASDASSDADLLARIQERGEIVVAMEGTWAPWTYHDETTSWWATMWRWLRRSPRNSA